ncbi:MAG: hypothetical protein QXJ28_03010 [Candidatus Pacearchaeota archaeon]
MHATVIIVFDEKPTDIEQAVEEAMMPYWEQDDGQYSELEFEISLERNDFDDRIKRSFEELHRRIAETEHKKKNLEYYSKLLRIKNTEGDIALLEEITGDEYNEDEDALGYWYNPNGEWDWYVIGGRWARFFKVKYRTPKDRTYIAPDSLKEEDPVYEDGVDGCYKGDLDVDDMKARTLKRLNPNQIDLVFSSKIQALPKYEQSNVPFYSEAVLLNGEWIPTEDNNTAWDIIKDLPDTCFLVLVDYHF